MDDVKKFCRECGQEDNGLIDWIKIPTRIKIKGRNDTLTIFACSPKCAHNLEQFFSGKGCVAKVEEDTPESDLKWEML